MENSESSQSVRVAVHIRPLLAAELLVGCTDCIAVYPAENQVEVRSQSFTFDNVFGSRGSPSSSIFDECVAPLVDALFHGYNGTVLAYGQTGSGKTYTMGTNYYGGEHGDAIIIPKVMDAIFSKVETLKESTEFLIRVSFIEVFKEEVFDLLGPNTRNPIQIQETVNGGITLAGVTESEIRIKEDLASYLSQGSLSRATGSTEMNSQSSRSHAIFSISMEQKRKISDSVGDDDVLVAKLHLVDLAGSERADRTGADQSRLHEGITINQGLFVLGNVISALGDDRKREEGGHVPYRDSKLTRILQDSLGGNCKTIMIACVSPAHTDAEETLNTLKYANRARNIQNKAIINRDPVTAEMQRMWSQIELLQSELLYFRGDSSAPTKEQILMHKVSQLEASNTKLKEALQESQINCEHLKRKAIDDHVEKDRLVMLVESIRNGNPLDEIDGKFDKAEMKRKVNELENEKWTLLKENEELRHNLANISSNSDDSAQKLEEYLQKLNVLEKQILMHKVSQLEASNTKLKETLQESQINCEHLKRKAIDDQIEKDRLVMLVESIRNGNPLDEIDGKYDKAEMKHKVSELENEKWTLQKEIEELRHNLANISSNSDDSAQKLEEYLQKLNVLEKQVSGRQSDGKGGSSEHGYQLRPKDQIFSSEILVDETDEEYGHTEKKKKKLHEKN